MFQGLRTVIYPVDDISTVKAWYTKVLRKEPYFDQPFYVGFNVGGYELGLDPNADRRPGQSGGEVAYWGVESAESAYAALKKLGARDHSPVQEVGEGIKVAQLLDPAGNVLGIIENPHFSLTE